MARASLFLAAWMLTGAAAAVGQVSDKIRIPPSKILVPFEVGPELAIVDVRRVDGSTERVSIGDVLPVEVLVRNTGGRPATVQAGTPGDPGRGEGPIRYGIAGTIPPRETVSLPLELHATGNRFRGERFVADVFLFETRGAERGIKHLFHDANNNDNSYKAEFGFRPPDERAIRVLAYNVQFLPPIADDSRCVELRAPLIAEKIELQAPAYDVLAFAEAFDDDARAILVRELADRFPHRTSILGSDRGVEQDGGVIILSRWPIESQDQRAFGSVCAGWDCQADKGVLYARIRTRYLTAHVFATHLEAQTRDIKRRQVDIIKGFIDAKRISSDQPVLIVGDFNIDAYNSAPDFVDMLRRLDADRVRLEGEPRFSKDDFNNDMASGIKQELIDHVLVSQAHLLPSRSRTRIQVFRSSWWEEEDDWSANECGTGSRQRSDVTNYQDLSDHYAVDAYLQW